MFFVSYRRQKPKQDWEELEDLMRSPARRKEDALVDVPRDLSELQRVPRHQLHKIAEALRLVTRPNAHVDAKERARLDRDRAKFISKTDHEKARLVFTALQEYDWKKEHEVQEATRTLAKR